MIPASLSRLAAEPCLQSFVMDFAALPATVQAVQWDLLCRHHASGNLDAVAACVRRQLAK